MLKQIFEQKRLRQAIESNKPIIPTTLCIELTNHCNAKCTFCPQPTKMKRPKGIMTNELFDILLDNIKKYKIKRAMLGGIGEPFLDKKIIDRIKKLKQIGVHVAVTTNGSLLDNFKPEEIVESGIDEISISMDAIDDVHLHKIKPGIKSTLDEIEGTIGKIYVHRTKNNSTTPFILLRYQMKENEIARNKKHKICDKVQFHEPHNWLGAIEDVAVGRVLDKKNRICNYFYKTIGINWDGTVSFCCMDYDNKIMLGNLFENDIVTIFNSKEINKVRKMFLDKTISKHPMCSGCYGLKHTDNKQVASDELELWEEHEKLMK